MSTSGDPQAVNQKIFNLGLSVETISLYLLCCGLAGSGMPISRQGILEKWNSSEETLLRGLEELESLNIICPEIVEAENSTVYSLTEDEDWITD